MHLVTSLRNLSHHLMRSSLQPAVAFKKLLQILRTLENGKTFSCKQATCHHTRITFPLLQGIDLLVSHHEKEPLGHPKDSQKLTAGDLLRKSIFQTSGKTAACVVGFLSRLRSTNQVHRLIVANSEAPRKMSFGNFFSSKHYWVFSFTRFGNGI